MSKLHKQLEKGVDGLTYSVCLQKRKRSMAFFSGELVEIRERKLVSGVKLEDRINPLFNLSRKLSAYLRVRNVS